LPIVLVFIFLLLIGLFIFKKRYLNKAQERNELNNPLLSDGGFILDPSSSQAVFGVARFGNDDYQPDGTLINTKLEISLPGFLALDYQTHFEILDPLTSSGIPKIFKAKLIDSNLQAVNPFITFLFSIFFFFLIIFFFFFFVDKNRNMG